MTNHCVMKSQQLQKKQENARYATCMLTTLLILWHTIGKPFTFAQRAVFKSSKLNHGITLAITSMI